MEALPRPIPPYDKIVVTYLAVPSAWEIELQKDGKRVFGFRSSGWNGTDLILGARSTIEYLFEGLARQHVREVDGA